MLAYVDLAPLTVVGDSTYMESQLRELVRQALVLLPLADWAEGTGRGYSTLQAYRSGDRNPTPAAARELATYLRSRAEEFSEMADALEAAAEEGDADG